MWTLYNLVGSFSKWRIMEFIVEWILGMFVYILVWSYRLPPSLTDKLSPSFKHPCDEGGLPPDSQKYFIMVNPNFTGNQ